MLSQSSLQRHIYPRSRPPSAGPWGGNPGTVLLGLRAASTQPGKCRTRGARHPVRGRGAGASHGTPESPWGRHFRLLVTGQSHDSREREAAGAPGGAGLGPHTGTVCPLRQAQGTEALRSHLPQQPGPGADDPRPGVRISTGSLSDHTCQVPGPPAPQLGRTLAPPSPPPAALLSRRPRLCPRSFSTTNPGDS